MTTPAGGEAAEGSAAFPPPGIREVNDMLKYEKWDKIRRKIRKDDLQDLGVPTPDMVKRCIDEGKTELAKELADYIIIESKGLHDL
jgi:hypothetical protein